jgi:hypothetical protein
LAHSIKRLGAIFEVLEMRNFFIIILLCSNVCDPKKGEGNSQASQSALPKQAQQAEPLFHVING